MSATLIYRDVDETGTATVSTASILLPGCNVSRLFGSTAVPGTAQSSNEPLCLETADYSLPDGSLATPVELEVAFSQCRSSAGLTFTFDEANDTFAALFEVNWYRDGVLLTASMFSADKPVYTAACAVERYDRLTVRFLKLNCGGVRLRVSNILCGVVRVINAADFIKGGCEVFLAADPTLATLPIGSVKFTFIASNDIPFYFAKRQTLQLYWNDELFGTYYLDSGVVAKGAAHSRVEIDAVDALGLVDQFGPYSGDAYLGDEAGPVLRAIVGGAAPVDIDPLYEHKLTWGWIPRGGRRDALAQLAFSLGAVIGVTPDGCIAMKPPVQSVTVLDGNSLYDNSAVTFQPPVTTLELTVHKIDPEHIGQETVCEEVVSGTRTILFDHPMNYIHIGCGTILECSANHVTFTGDGVNETIIQCMPFTHTTILERRGNGMAGKGAEEKVLALSDMTMVNPMNYAEVLDRLLPLTKQDRIFESDILLPLAASGNMGVTAVTTDAPPFFAFCPLPHACCVAAGMSGAVTRLALTFGSRRVRAAVTVIGVEAVPATHGALAANKHAVLADHSHTQVMYM